MNYKKVNASIITIGDELLIGQTIDTNSAWIAQQLNPIGVWVRRRVAVGDDREEILQALDEEGKGSDVILITGGLGPTADDITKPVLCEYFGGKMIVDEGALDNIKEIFEKYLKRPIIERNLKQAEVPDVCTVLLNKRGTAPGMLFKKDGKVFISMPGVPHEMKGLMTDHVLPYILGSYSLPAVVHRTLLTAGIGESELAERLMPFENNLPEHIKLAYLPNYGMLRLRLTANGEKSPDLENEIKSFFEELQKLVKDIMVINEDKNIEEALGELLKSLGKKLSAAESCTGGYIAHLLTKTPGASAYFNGGVVSYDNNVKKEVLKVKNYTLGKFGAVSEQTVTEMALGVQQLLHTDYAIAVSGIMGPDGGTDEKPVGTVWVAVVGKKIIAKKFQFRFNRERNIELTAANALNMLRLLVIAENET